MNVQPALDTTALLPETFARWFARRGWTPRAHQLELLAKARARPLGAADRADRRRQDAGRVSCRPGGAERGRSRARQARPRTLISTGRGIRRAGGLHTLYISPLKALAVDIARNLETPVAEMGLPIRIETRTGDTPASKRQRQRRDPPRHPADHAGAARAAARLAPTRRICSARCGASCSTNCTRWSPRSAAICSRSASRGCFALAPELDQRRPVGDGRRARRPAPLPGAAAAKPARRCADLVVAARRRRARRHHARHRRATCRGPATRRATPSARSTS